jgi:hypothetical protein
MTDVQLAERRTEVHWRIGTIDGQLIDPDFDRPDEEWVIKAKSALNYSRREGSAINNIFTERAARRRESGEAETTLMEVLGAFHREHLAVARVLEAQKIEDDKAEERAWEWLEQTHAVIDTLDVRTWQT